MVTYLMQYIQAWHLEVIFVLILADLLLGLVAAWRRKEFNLPAVGEFYLNMILPYLGGYIVMCVAVAFIQSKSDFQTYASTFVTIATVVVNGGVAAIVIPIIASITRNIKEIYSGSPLFDGILARYGSGAVLPTVEDSLNAYIDKSGAYQRKLPLD